MQMPNIENIIVDEANQRTYVVLAQIALSDGRINRAIRVEISRQGGEPVGHGRTLTFTVLSGEGAGSSNT